MIQLGLTEDDIKQAYQPSFGGVFHTRGAENAGKTLWIAHDYRYLIDSGLYTPYDAVGNLTFKGKYGVGYQVLKGDDLREYLWIMTHKPLKRKIVIIDEADSEFPARGFNSLEQTEIALRLWHTSKLGNRVYMSSHLGEHSVDLIMHLASHYYIYPQKPDFRTNTMEYGVYNVLDNSVKSGLICKDIIKTMLIYNRQEPTESMDDALKTRPSKKKSQVEDIIDDEINNELEWKEARELV